MLTKSTILAAGVGLVAGGVLNGAPALAGSPPPGQGQGQVTVTDSPNRTTHTWRPPSAADVPAVGQSYDGWSPVVGGLTGLSLGDCEDKRDKLNQGGQNWECRPHGEANNDGIHQGADWFWDLHEVSAAEAPEPTEPMYIGNAGGNKGQGFKNQWTPKWAPKGPPPDLGAAGAGAEYWDGGWSPDNNAGTYYVGSLNDCGKHNC
ncbi:hypothetical protein ACQP2E_26580 [Actinoplanes sp. CA-015351]|uniref:hypothetical protein n=1 Tax=Actinoplanes sp. CA-015351 TaxID=3239897 RepID=UPI003D97F71F